MHPVPVHPAPTPVTDLREMIRLLERGTREHRIHPFGVAAIDTRLANGGLRLDALHEVAADGARWGDDAAALLFLAGIAARCTGPVLWVVRARDLFAPGLFQAGLSPERVLYAEARDDPELLALMEEGLRHRGLGAVIGEVRRAATAQTRRLQLAAEGGNTIALLLRRPSRVGEDPLAMPSTAATRWRIAATPSPASPWGGLGPACWQLTCVRQRGGDGFELVVEASDETGRILVPARLVDRPVAAGAPRRAAG